MVYLYVIKAKVFMEISINNIFFFTGSRSDTKQRPRMASLALQREER